MRTAVFFHFFEKNELYRENLVYFLSVAYRNDLDFYIVVSGASSVVFPDFENISYIYTENINNDYGGYARALAQLKDIDQYDYFIFVNSSCRGPFLPKSFHRPWVDILLEKLVRDTHLVGSSINIIHDDSKFALNFRAQFDYQQPYSHVQTTAYALTKCAMKHLIGVGFYSIQDSLTKIDIVSAYEIRLSQEIKRAGWNFTSLLGKYSNIDYRRDHRDINWTSDQGDPLYKNAYFGTTAKPRELVFIKTNRNLISPIGLYWHTILALRAVKDKRVRAWSEYRDLRRVASRKLYWSLRLSLRKSLLRLFGQAKRVTTGS